MSALFFSQLDRIAALRAAAESWVGTPFRVHARIKGYGVDCVNLAHALMTEAGMTLPAIGLTDYPLDWAQHRNRSLLVEWIEQMQVCQLVATHGPRLAGDVLCFRQGRISHHIGVMLDERWFIHVPLGRVVQLGMIDDPTFATALERVYRPLEVGVAA